MNEITAPLRKFLPFLVTAFLLQISGCSDDSARQEQITKLRALGVEQTPVVGTPGSTIQLTFHLAGPPGLVVNAASYTDTAFRYGETVVTNLVDAAPVETNLGKLSHYTLRGQYVVPSAGKVPTLISLQGNTRIRFGVAFTADSEEEVVVGDTLVYPSGAEQATWTAPTIAIEQPIVGTISSTTALLGNIQSTHEESNRVAWFVSSGKVKTRRAKSTEWKEAATGEQTLFLTTRGLKSGAFAIKALKVTVQ